MRLWFLCCSFFVEPFDCSLRDFLLLSLFVFLLLCLMDPDRNCDLLVRAERAGSFALCWL